MQKSFVMRALLMFVVIVFSLIVLQAVSVSSVQSVTFVGSAGYFEVAGVAHINQSPYVCTVGGYCYVNFTSFFAVPVSVTMSVDASRLDLQEFQQLVNVARSVSVNNFSAIDWGNGTVELLAVNFTNVLQNTTEWVDVGGSEFGYSGKMWRGLTLGFKNKGLAQYRLKLRPKSYGGLIEYSILGNASGLFAEFDPLLNATAFNATSQSDTNISVADFAPFVDGKWLMGAGNRSNVTGYDGWGDLNYNANPDWKAYLKPDGGQTCAFSVTAAQGWLSLKTDDIGVNACTIEAIRDVNISVPKEAGIIISWSQQRESSDVNEEAVMCFVADSAITNVTAGRCNGGNDILFVGDGGVASHRVYGLGGAGASGFGTGTTSVTNFIVWMNWSHFSACSSDACSGLKAFNSPTQAQSGYVGFAIYDNIGAPLSANFSNISISNATQFGQPFNLTPARFETVLINSTAVVDKVKITNTTYKTAGAQANFFVMDANHKNQQSVAEGNFVDIADFTGLIVNATFTPPDISTTSEFYGVMVEWSAPLPAVLPFVNVSIINRTSSNASVILASEHVWSNANYSHASNLPEENSTFKWLTNNTDSAGVRTAELVPMIYKGTVGYWHFDSVNGSNVTFDSSGRGNNGNLSGFNQSNATTAGIINSGLQFDGKDDYINLGNINFNWSASNFTAVLWANMLSPAGVVGGLVSNRDGSGPWWTLGWYEYDIRGEIQVELGNGSTQTYLRSGIYPANKGWQHYALTKSGLTWTLYYNGVLNKTITTASTFANIGAQTADVAIGRWSGNTQVWNGTIDEVAIYNRSLTPTEIKQLYLRTWYDVSPEVLLAHMDNASDNLVNATLMGSHHAPATLMGGVNCTAEVAGVYGQACKFDGVNDYINVSRNPIFNFGKGDYSVEFWLNWAGSSSTNAIMGKRETGNWWRAYISDTGILTVEQENNNADLEMAPEINRWYYVAVVRNVALGTSYLYINGVQNDTATATGLDVSNNGDFLIGKYSTTFFNGTIDEVRLSRKALTAQEINESFSKGRAFFQNEYLLNSSNYVAGDTLKLEYIPRDSAGAVGAVQNSSSLNVHAPKIADESEGDIAIEAGINSSLPSATKYSSQQAYVRNLSNNQTLGRFDWVASFGSQRWLLNYITTGESYVTAPNLTTAVYVLEIADKTSAQITDEVSRLINATKG